MTRSQRVRNRLEVYRLRQERKNRREAKRSFSKLVMAGVMLMFFAGGLLGTYATIHNHEPVSVTLDYITKLALPVGLGYFVKAFGENIAKIILSAVFGAKFPGSTPEPQNEEDESQG